MNPPFCNIVEEGSSMDLTLGSLTTATATTIHHEIGWILSGD